MRRAEPIAKPAEHGNPTAGLPHAQPVFSRWASHEHGARAMRTPHSTPDVPHARHRMDAMRPWRAFGTPPAPSALDPRRWLGVVLRMVADVAARLGVTARAPVGGAES